MAYTEMYANLNIKHKVLCRRVSNGETTCGSDSSLQTMPQKKKGGNNMKRSFDLLYVIHSFIHH